MIILTIIGILLTILGSWQTVAWAKDMYYEFRLWGFRYAPSRNKEIEIFILIVWIMCTIAGVCLIFDMW